MEKIIKVAVMGCGHIGSFVSRAVLLASDMKLVGIIEAGCKIEEIQQKFPGIQVVSSWKELPEKPEVLILGLPSRMVIQLAPELLAAGINTVDCFDMHGEPFMNLRNTLSPIAVSNQCVSIMGAGVDPGVSTIMRALFEMWAPTGLTYVTYGPGMSMGHTVAAKSYPGVQDALSITRPGDPGCHKRDLYLVIADGFEFEEVKSRILQDSYFCHDDVRVFQVDDVNPLVDMGHRIHVFRKGGASGIDNQLLDFETTFHNPASTAQVMVGCARATTHLAPGAYTMLEVPPLAYLAGGESLLKKLF
jgi:diaminopimelate dehydrogenase